MEDTMNIQLILASLSSDTSMSDITKLFDSFVKLLQSHLGPIGGGAAAAVALIVGTIGSWFATKKVGTFTWNKIAKPVAGTTARTVGSIITSPKFIRGAGITTLASFLASVFGIAYWLEPSRNLPYANFGHSVYLNAAILATIGQIWYGLFMTFVPKRFIEMFEINWRFNILQWFNLSVPSLGIPWLLHHLPRTSQGDLPAELCTLLTWLLFGGVASILATSIVMIKRSNEI